MTAKDHKIYNSKMEKVSCIAKYKFLQLQEITYMFKCLKLF